MNIDLSSLSSNGIYHLMTQTVIPRPIAWVLSRNTDDGLNLAPFSYFNGVCSDPPLFMLSLGKKPSGIVKDTAVNLTVGAFCVVHIAHAGQSEQVTNTAATLEYGESEVKANEISLIAHQDWPIKRVQGCPIAYLCKVHSIQELGNTPQRLIFVQALKLYIDDKVVSEKKGRVTVDALKVNPLSRLGASEYASLGTVFSATRPK